MTLVLPLVVAVAVFGAVYLAAERRLRGNPAARIAPYVRRASAPAAELFGPEETGRLAAFERGLRRLPRWASFERSVAQADIGLAAPVAFAALVGGIGGIAGLALLAGARPLTALFFVLVAVTGVRLAYALRVGRRRRAFDDQLPEILSDLGSALRAGHGFDQALQAVAADAPEPAGAELQRVLAEMRLGRPLEQALTDLGARIGSRDLLFALDAIIVQRQVGGSLAVIFELVADSVRQRHQYALRLRSLTAMGRTSALVLLALPFAMGLGLALLSPGYLTPLLQSSLGRLLLLGALGLLAVGSVWLRRIVSGAGVGA